LPETCVFGLLNHVQMPDVLIMKHLSIIVFHDSADIALLLMCLCV